MMAGKELGQTMGAEWTKMWSVRSTWWCLLSGAVLMVLSTLTLGGSTATEMLRNAATGPRFAASEPVISASVFAQFTLVTLAMLVITSEYASAAMRTTLTATPIRGRLLMAKTLVVMPVMFVAGVAFGAISAAVTYAVLSTDLFGGYVTLPPTEVASDLVRLGVYLALVSALALGVGAALRSAAGTLTVVFMLLIGLPLMLAMAGGQVGVDVSMRMPMFAGLAFMGSADNLTGGPVPYSAGEGLAWLIGWTVAAITAGYVVLRRRDA